MSNVPIMTNVPKTSMSHPTVHFLKIRTFYDTDIGFHAAYPWAVESFDKPMKIIGQRA